MDEKMLGFDTLAVHAGQRPDPTTGAAMKPIYATATYAQPELGVSTGYDYARTVNPTRSALEASLAALEGGRFGLCFSSGMAAVTTLMSLLFTGDHVVVSENTYGGTYRLFEQLFTRFGLRFSWAKTSDLRALQDALTGDTKMLYLETPTNPVMSITDIAAASEIAKRVGITTVVDNTFMTPYFQRPLALGADVVVHSTTKYLNGHSDCVGGAIVTANEELHERLKWLQNSAGAVPSPFDCFLVLRGTKTLAVRMRQHEANGLSVAHFLAAHPNVLKVYCPGLDNHPGRRVQERQAGGYGAMVAFDLGSLDSARRCLNSLEMFTLAESLGGVESLACHPATMTHAAVPEALRMAMGFIDGLVRLSVGIEEEEDLLDDMRQALES